MDILENLENEMILEAFKKMNEETAESIGDEELSENEVDLANFKFCCGLPVSEYHKKVKNERSDFAEVQLMIITKHRILSRLIKELEKQYKSNWKVHLKNMDNAISEGKISEQQALIEISKDEYALKLFKSDLINCSSSFIPRQFREDILDKIIWCEPYDRYETQEEGEI